MGARFRPRGVVQRGTMPSMPTPKPHPFVVQCRLSERQYRYLKLAAATDYSSASYAPVIRELIDAAIDQASPKWRKLLDGTEEQFMQHLVDNL